MFDSKKYILYRRKDNGLNTINKNIMRIFHTDIQFEFDDNSVLENMLINKIGENISIKNITFVNCVFDGIEINSILALKRTTCINCKIYP